MVRERFLGLLLFMVGGLSFAVEGVTDFQKVNNLVSDADALSEAVLTVDVMLSDKEVVTEVFYTMRVMALYSDYKELSDKYAPANLGKLIERPHRPEDFDKLFRLFRRKFAEVHTKFRANLDRVMADIKAYNDSNLPKEERLSDSRSRQLIERQNGSEEVALWEQLQATVNSKHTELMTEFGESVVIP